MIRYIARQVPPDMQEPQQWYKEMERLVLVREGRWAEKFQSCNAYDIIEAKLFEWLDDWDSLKNDAEGIHEFLRYEGLAEFDDDAWQWQSLLDYLLLHENEAKRETIKCIFLNLLAGGNWQSTTLHGSSQSDWVTCYYDAQRYSSGELTQIEIDFFNEGSQWVCTSVDGADEFSVYCYGYDECQELADACGVAADEIKLLRFAGYSRVPVWE